MMKRPSLAALRRLDRALVYSPLSDFVAKKVRVLSAETALDDILRAVSEFMPITVTTMGPGVHYRAGAIAKYGILDVTYGVEATPSLPIHRPGIGVLRTLSLVEDAVDEPEGLHASQSFLNDLAGESEGGNMYLKVFLQSETLQPGEDSLRRLREGLPAGFWPHVFVVQDACLTNASSIWFAKHFYM